VDGEAHQGCPAHHFLQNFESRIGHVRVLPAGPASQSGEAGALGDAVGEEGVPADRETRGAARGSPGDEGGVHPRRLVGGGRRGARTRTAWSAAARTSPSAWFSRRRANRCWDQPPAAVRDWTYRVPLLCARSSRRPFSPTCANPIAYPPRRRRTTAISRGTTVSWVRASSSLEISWTGNQPVKRATVPSLEVRRTAPSSRWVLTSGCSAWNLPHQRGSRSAVSSRWRRLISHSRAGRYPPLPGCGHWRGRTSAAPTCRARLPN